MVTSYKPDKPQWASGDNAGSFKPEKPNWASGSEAGSYSGVPAVTVHFHPGGTSDGPILAGSGNVTEQMTNAKAIKDKEVANLKVAAIRKRINNRRK